MQRTVLEILYQMPGFQHVVLTEADLPDLREAGCLICMVDFEVGAIATQTPLRARLSLPLLDARLLRW